MFCMEPLLVGILIPTNKRFGPLPIFAKDCRKNYFALEGAMV
jgi:hypothetical protein